MLFWILNFELHRYCNILYVLVSFRDFLLRKRRLAARADVHRAIILVDQSLVVYLLEHPPYRFHERLIHRAVCVLHVGPAADARNYFLPLMRIGEDARAARLVERINTVSDDFFFMLESELLLDDILYRKPVAIPAPHPRHPVAAQRPKSLHDVLDDGGDDVPVVRQPGGKRRPVVENVLAILGGPVDRFIEDVAFFPEFQYFFFSK